MKSDAWYPLRGSARGGEPTFAEAVVKGEVAPIPVVRASIIGQLKAGRVSDGGRARAVDPV
jgi:hypothetical protein